MYKNVMQLPTLMASLLIVGLVHVFVVSRLVNYSCFVNENRFLTVGAERHESCYVFVDSCIVG